MQKKLLALACSALFVAACSDGPTGTTQEPLLNVYRTPGAQLVPGRYIVLFKKGKFADVGAEARRIVSGESGRMLFVYDKATHGFAADLSDAAIERLRRNPNISLIEQDGVVKLDATQAPTPSWGLDRIDQANLPLNNSYTYPNTGAGVHFYGIDTGILGGINGTATTPHVDIAGRLSTGFDAITIGGNANDCNGHGTHTATTAAGTTYGVAKSATVHPVRVLDCGGSGLFSQVQAGINWVTGDHQAHPGQNSVANMSLGGGADAATDAAVNASIAAGVVYSLSAGNSFGADACTQSPARVTAGLTVMAFDINDRLANFSNIGTCTDLGAPGVNITAGWIGSPTATSTISGTSMSAPHVAGAAMLYLSANPGSTVAQVNAAIINNATNGIITGVGGGAFPANSPNKNLNIQFIGGGGPTNQPPVASFTWSCTGLSCTFNGTGSSDPDGTIASYNWTISSGTSVSTASSFSRTFPSARTFTLTLTVTDNQGATNSTTQTITVTGGGSNQPPVASFTYSCTAAHACTFTSTSTDPDGTIASYAWKLAAGNTVSTAASFSKTFPSARTFALTLTVTDNGGASTSTTQTITVP
ncbi:MAG: S8 family serine peptidase [Gemmatimonadales bacterium]